MMHQVAVLAVVQHCLKDWHVTSDGLVLVVIYLDALWTIERDGSICIQLTELTCQEDAEFIYLLIVYTAKVADKANVNGRGRVQ